MVSVSRETVRVAAVIVAYNRSALLAESLAALAKQTVLPASVIVVNNASTDDTARVAAVELEKIAGVGVATRLINLTENTGGAGGFAVGIAAALATGNSDWVWVMDDDTIPHPDALERAMKAHSLYKETGQDDLVLMGSRVVWTDGDLHPMNTVREKDCATANEKRRTARAGGYASRSNSFVSAFLRTEVVRLVGLPIADFFIWVDDFEMTLRLTRKGRGMLVTESVAVHKTVLKYSSRKEPGARFFNEVRNKLWTLRFSKGMGPVGRIYLAARTLRRWALVLMFASDKRAVCGMLRDGIRASRTAPRSNVAVLAGCGVPDDVMRVIVELDKKV